MEQFGEDGKFNSTRFKRALKFYGISDLELQVPVMGVGVGLGITRARDGVGIRTWGQG